VPAAPTFPPGHDAAVAGRAGGSLEPRARRIRVTLVSHYFPAHRGGVESVAWEIAARLASGNEAEITWHSSATDPPPRELPGLHCVPARACNAGERRLGFPYPLWTPPALAALVRAVRDSDVVHLHDCLYLPNLVAFATARLSGRPVIVTQHIGMVPYRNSLLRALLAGANRLLGALVLGAATQTVFVSDTVLRYFQRFVRFRNPPLLVPNGVDATLFSPADPAHRRALRARLGVGPRTPLLLFVGRFVEKKGLPVLRELTERLPHARWIFAGWGPLDPQIWSKPNVSVEHNLTKEQLVPLYQAADLLVLPSVGEGFPLVVQEAMACGTPALVGEETAAGCPGAGDLLLHDRLGFPDTAACWAARIEALFALPETTFEALRIRVAEFARTSWSWEQCARRYAELLRACTNQP